MSVAGTSVWRPQQRIRPLSVGIVWRADELLLEQVCNDEGRVEGWRPLGGGIEFGERAADALKREFAEELNVEVCDPILLTVMENHYEHYGLRGHEVVFVFETGFTDPRVYERDQFQVKEADMAVHAEWMSLTPFTCGDVDLYPAGLLNILDGRTQR